MTTALVPKEVVLVIEALITYGTVLTDTFCTT